MPVRQAREDELDRVNELRRQVNDLHVKGKPEVFREGFPDELRDFVYEIFRDPDKTIAVNERDGEIVGMAVISHIVKPETPFMKERDFLDIDELCVDEAHRRTGAAKELVEFVKEYARTMGIDRIELNMWEFNSEALAFYEALGFETFRRYLEMKL